MRKRYLLIIAILIAVNLNAQVSINTDGSQPDNSAMLQVKSTTKGFLPPQMTTAQRDAIANPAEGLVIYNIECKDVQYFNGAGWVPLGNTNTAIAPGTITGNDNPCQYATGVTYSVTPVPWMQGYNWTVPTDAIITSGQGTASITVTFGALSGVVCVSAYGNCWRGLGSCLPITLSPLPAAPIAGVQVASQTQINWNWEPVQGVTGYKFNSVDDYSTAEDLGSITTKTETELTCNTAYTRYVWAYNTCGNSTPVTFSQTTSACSFACGSSFTDSRDNKVYTTVLIGSQCWMAQNLNIGTLINGSQEQTDNQVIEKYCYSDLESNCEIYGGLYQWDEAMQYVTTQGVQGICPTGYHIPTDGEWTNLTTFLGGSLVAGDKMKSTGTIESGIGLWHAPNTGATNESGFTAVPAGNRDYDGTFTFIGYLGFWWSSSEGNTGDAWYRYLSFSSSRVFSHSDSKNYGFSVRCLHD